MSVSVPDEIRSILEEFHIVDAPKLPALEKLATYARARKYHTTVMWSEESELDVLATVRAQGQTFRGEAKDPVTALAFAVAQALEALEPRQLELEDE